MQALPEVEALLRIDMIEAIAQKIDQTAINGTGSSNQTTGILNTTGIGLLLKPMVQPQLLIS